MRAKILPGITHWQSPYFMAFFPCSSSYPAMLADMYSNAFNGAHFNWVCSPAVTELETVVMDWLAKALALPESFLSTGPTRGGGVIQGTASEAILTVMVAARDKLLAERTANLPDDSEEKEEETWRLRSRLVALGSDMTHSSTKKAAKILGVRFATVPVSKDTGYALSASGLESTLSDLREKGLEPFFLTATFGTTDTCAVDDLAGITSLLQRDPRDSVWLHLDAAYAGAALICPEHQSLNRHLAAFHSIGFNPHKWLLTNFDCSALWIRNRAWLNDALSVNPAYLRNDLSEAGLVTDYRDWQIPLGRRFRSLKLWFLMRTYGLDGLRKHVRDGIERGDMLGGLLRGRRDLFEIVTGPTFALVVFRLARTQEGQGEEERNALTKRFFDAVSSEGKVYLTSTSLKGLFAVRVCVSGPLVEEKHVREVFEILARCAEEVMGKKQEA